MRWESVASSAWASGCAVVRVLSPLGVLPACVDPDIAADNAYGRGLPFYSECANAYLLGLVLGAESALSALRRQSRSRAYYSYCM